jgi:hypothetical protein
MLKTGSLTAVAEMISSPQKLLSPRLLKRSAVARRRIAR